MSEQTPVKHQWQVPVLVDISTFSRTLDTTTTTPAVGKFYRSTEATRFSQGFGSSSEATNIRFIFGPTTT